MIALTSYSVLEKGFSKEAYRFLGDIDKSRKINLILEDFK